MAWGVLWLRAWSLHWIFIVCWINWACVKFSKEEHILQNSTIDSSSNHDFKPSMWEISSCFAQSCVHNWTEPSKTWFNLKTLWDFSVAQPSSYRTAGETLLSFRSFLTYFGWISCLWNYAFKYSIILSRGGDCWRSTTSAKLAFSRGTASHSINNSSKLSIVALWSVVI